MMINFNSGRITTGILPIFVILAFTSTWPTLGSARVTPRAETQIHFDGWQQVRSEDGVQIFKHWEEDSPIVEVGGEVRISAPLLNVINVLVGKSLQKVAQNKKGNSLILAQLTPLDVISYHYFDFPMVSDRDLLIRSQITVDSANRRVFISSSSIRECETGVVDIQAQIAKFISPGSDVVRAEVEFWDTELVEIEPGTTLARTQLKVDLKPAYLLRGLTNKVLPVVPLKELKRIARKALSSPNPSGEESETMAAVIQSYNSSKTEIQSAPPLPSN